MSHDATSWALKQRGFKPATKLVLWHLCDRYHPDHGCFPSQETLANDCEMSRSALNDHLAVLEQAGLILREQRRDRHSRKQISTYYRFAFQADFPCPKSGHGQGEAVSEKQPEPCPENDETRVRNSDTNLVREPVIEPVTERERGSEPESKEIRKANEKAFKKAFSSWPTWLTDSEPGAYRAWNSLSIDERQLACEEIGRYVEAARATGRKHICSFAVYLSEKRWEKLPAPAQVAANAPAQAAPFGKMWAARVYELLLAGATHVGQLTALEQRMVEAGTFSVEHLLAEKQSKFGFPAVNDLFERAAGRRGALVPAYLQAMAERMVAVKVGGDLWQAWVATHAVRGWPWLPNTGTMEYVYLPEGGPDALEKLQALLRGIEK